MAVNYTKDGLPFDDLCLIGTEYVPVIFSDKGVPIPVDAIIDSTKKDIVASAEAQDSSIPELIDTYRANIKYKEQQDVLNHVTKTIQEAATKSAKLQSLADSILGDDF